MKLEARQLSKDYNGIRALDGLNFCFEGPGLVGYLGPNGAGKTTTLKLFAGLLRPTQGSALVNDLDVLRDHKRALKILSALVETPEPYPHQTVKEFLEFIGKIRGLDHDNLVLERINYVKAKLSLGDLSKKCGTLSKGNKQRVVLAATLLPDNDILILDEPTSGLDPAEARDARDLLKEFARNKLILMSSHLLYEVTETCDRIVFINHGKLILIDTIESVRKRFGKGEGSSVSDLEQIYAKLIREGGEVAGTKSNAE